MSNDITDFLRRVAQRRGQQPPPDIEILDADIVEDAEIIEADEVSGDDVAQQVADHLNASKFDESASHLGESVDRADDRMEAHLHKVFEHSLGQLGGRTSVAEGSVFADEQPPSEADAKSSSTVTATSLAEMLRHPQYLRSAILLSEIFQRPEDRWQ